MKKLKTFMTNIGVCVLIGIFWTTTRIMAMASAFTIYECIIIGGTCLVVSSLNLTLGIKNISLAKGLLAFGIGILPVLVPAIAFFAGEKLKKNKCISSVEIMLNLVGTWYALIALNIVILL